MADGWRKFEKRQAVRAIDVARAAQVSQSAVSRVFRGGSVAPQRRAEILKVAKALGYWPDAMARAIITRRSGIVGILLSSATNLHGPDVLTTLCRALAMSGMRAMVFVVETKSEIDAAIDQALAYRVDGVIALTDIADAHANALSQLGSILVLYNLGSENGAADRVGCDHEDDAAELARHLLDKNATNFWIFAGPETSALANQRLTGILRGLRSSAALITVECDIGDCSFESGVEAVARHLATGQAEPHAVIAVNARMAMGAVEALRAADRSARRTISIATFDDPIATQSPRFEMITMTQPHAQLAAAAVEIIAARLHGEPDVSGQRTFRSTLSGE